MIKKIIVEMDDAEVTFHEFNSVAEFQASEVFKQESATTVEAAPVEVAPVAETPAQ